MAEQRHPNSKRITIFRAGSFLENAQKEAQDFMSMSKKSIGSYFAGNLGPAVGTGLSFDEVDVLLPLLIDVPKDDRIFREKVTDFYTKLCTTVPYGTGKELEVGLELDNEKPVTYTNTEGKRNLPIHLQDYIRYRHAIKHPQVAADIAEARGNMLKQFYVFDPEATKVENAQAGRVRDEAIKEYMTMKIDIDKVGAMLTLLGTDIRAAEFQGVGREDALTNKLYSYVSAAPDEFLKIVKVDHFDIRVLIRRMLATEVIRRIGAQLVDRETGAILGHTEEEAIFWLQDKENSDKVSFLKAKLQEAMKKKMPARKPTQMKTTTR